MSKKDNEITEGKKYLRGVTLHWGKYTRYSEDWSHDHCEFCYDVFSETVPEDLHEGYATEDEYHWICKECFGKYKNLFQWKIIKNKK